MMMSRLFGEVKKKNIFLKFLPQGKSIMLGHSVSLTQISSFTYCLLPPSLIKKIEFQHNLIFFL